MPRRPVRGSVFHSIQARMVLIFLLIILLVMELIGTFLARSLQQYYEEQYFNELAETANYMASVASGVDFKGIEASGALERLVTFYAMPGLEISLVDGAGRVLASYPDTGAEQSLIDRLEIRRALQEGQLRQIVREDSDAGTRKVYLAVPVAGGGGQIQGAVSLVGSLERVDQILGGMRPILLMATLLALLVAAVLSVILARTITGPVREVTARAAELAGGRFDRLIRVRSEDEIGQLASMFNHLTIRLRDTLAEISAEKRKAEAILNHMTDGIIALDRDGHLILINPAAARMLHLEPQRWLGWALAEAAPDLGLGEALEQVLGGQEVVTQIVMEPRELVLRAQLAPLKDVSGWVAGVVIVLHDQTQQARLDSMRREFVANVSHELRTPITTIKSYVETLLDGAREDPETGDRFLKVVAAETERMVRLVNDLLTLSQIDSGQVRWERRPLDSVVLVHDVCEKFGERCRRKGLDLRAAYTPDLPWIQGDRDRLEQVLSNLLNNAVDFTPVGGRIEVAVEAAGDGLRFRVRDTGMGIPPDDLSRIFERFYRVDKARSREFGGTGLGLSIAREIIEAHGGEIEIESAVGQGTEVRFTLPFPGAG